MTTNFRTESIVLKVKLAKTWITVVGVYRPPSIPKSEWKQELSMLFKAATSLANDVFFLGDFDCDLLQPDKPPKDGQDLSDLMGIFNLVNLIKSPTRMCKTSETLLDLIFMNNKKRILSSGVVDVQISDHFLVYAVLRASALRSCSRRICFRSLKTFNQDLFLRDLYSTHFHIMDIFDDIDDKLYVFESLYLDILDEHAPC